MIAFMITWALSWPSLLISGINLVFPTATPLWLAVAGGVFLACYVLLYLIGFFSTFPGRLALGQLVLRLLEQILLLPVFSFMEACGVLYGLVSPPKDFYVVRKSAQAAAAAAVHPAENAGASSLRENAAKD